MKKFRRIIFFLLSISVSFAILLSCKEKNDEYPPRTWSDYSYTGSGIAARNISTLFYENEHSLWLGAQGSEGLLYFDGYTWNIFDKENTGIEFDSVTSISRDGNDKIWVGWKSGLATYDGSKWRNINQFSGLRVTSVAVEGIGIIRVGIKGVSGGLATLRNEEWKFETLTNSDIPSENINSMVSDHGQVLWMASADKGVMRLKNAEWQNISDNLPLITQNFGCITKAPDGSIWAGSTASQLIHFHTDTFTILNTGTSEPITSIVTTGDGNVWCSTPGAGLIKFDGINWTSYTIENAALPSDHILCLSAGSPGYLLFSTEGGKLNLIKQ